MTGLLSLMTRRLLMTGLRMTGLAGGLGHGRSAQTLVLSGDGVRGLGFCFWSGSGCGLGTELGSAGRLLGLLVG